MMVAEGLPGFRYSPNQVGRIIAREGGDCQAGKGVGSVPARSCARGTHCKIEVYPVAAIIKRLRVEQVLFGGARFGIRGASREIDCKAIGGLRWVEKNRPRVGG